MCLQVRNGLDFLEFEVLEHLVWDGLYRGVKLRILI